MGCGERYLHATARTVLEFLGNAPRRPTKARSQISDDVLICILEGGFMKAEQTLRDAGRGDAVAVQRDAFQDVLRDRFIETVEQLVGRRVISFMSGVDLHTETSAEVFVLESTPVETGDEREAVAAWAEQTRRQSQALRQEQAALRREQAQLRKGGSPDSPEGSEP